jgi:hypothetical protein
MSNVKPGDLAMVVRPSGFAGATCRVLSADSVVPARLLEQFGPHWVVEFPRPMPWGTMTSDQPATMGSMPDRFLRKLAGPDVILSTAACDVRQVKT